ncbi:MAG: type II toxin-antitoxin system prevent-host-death family antitoxin [Terracidiphilus sp.]
MKVNVHQAKTNLSKLILRAEAGEEVVIARDGKPVVRLVPLDAPASKLFKPGALKGRLLVPADFLLPNSDVDREIERAFYRHSAIPERKPGSAPSAPKAAKNERPR